MNESPPPPLGPEWSPPGQPDWPAPQVRLPPAVEPPRSGPGRGWYAVALALVGVTVVGCCLGGLVGTRVVPDPLATAKVGESLQVTMGAEEEFAVVVKLDAVLPQDVDVTMVHCEVSGPGSHRMHWAQWEWLLTTGDGNWRLDHHITVPGAATATYEVTCKAKDPHVTEFGIAEAPDSQRPWFGAAAMVCCPCLLLPAAAILTLVIRTKRTRARRPAPPH